VGALHPAALPSGNGAQAEPCKAGKKLQLEMCMERPRFYQQAAPENFKLF